MLLSNCVTLTAHRFHGTKISLQHRNKDRVFTLTTTNSFIHSPEIFEHWKTYKILSVQHNKKICKLFHCICFSSIIALHSLVKI